MWRRRAAVRSPVNFACRRWIFRCGRCRWKNFWARCRSLLDRGLKQFKFVDRTFNLNVATSKAILEFFLARHQPGMFFHFEMIPDRLPAELRAVIAKFPPGALQFEVGIQTFNPEVGTHISRRQNYERLADNFHFLRRETGVHIHADLIVGLPGETLESFARGFRPADRAGSAGNPGGHLETAARHADCAARRGMADDLQRASALRNPAKQAARFCHDATAAAVSQNTGTWSATAAISSPPRR